MPTVLRETYPTAKKEHICEFCGYKIQPGQKYVRQTNVYDGVLHDLIRTEYNDCKTCSLYSVCYENLPCDKLCNIKGSKGISYKYINCGKVTNIKTDKEK